MLWWRGWPANRPVCFVQLGVLCVCLGVQHAGAPLGFGCGVGGVPGPWRGLPSLALAPGGVLGCCWQSGGWGDRACLVPARLHWGGLEGGVEERQRVGWGVLCPLLGCGVTRFERFMLGLGAHGVEIGIH
ncbi:hypothetical protein XENORESO_008023 [Xenotaenia resolanae]|uniref:Secreted protein n=1 Tax=Xenotaenia resolanae TaxID=208358 RepID=A0ABV0W2R7_9TELE